MAKKPKGVLDVSDVLNAWVERDLAADAEEGKLPPAFEVDALVAQLSEAVGSGRHPVVSGDSGVGKSALVFELVRRVVAGSGPTALAGRPILQISFRSRLSALLKPEQLRPETQKLVTALLAVGDQVVPYFRDFELVYSLDLEPQLQLLALRFPGVILAEGDGRGVDTLLEATPELDRRFLAVKVPEPDLATTARMLAAWAKHGEASDVRFEAEALSTGLELAHRFLSRTNLPRKAIDFLAQVGSVVGTERSVQATDVVDRFHTAYKIPRLLIDPRVPFDPVATEREYESRVLEQSEAVSAVVRMISMIKAGLSDSRRPFGSFLFVGPTGVGKTHIAQLLAEHLFGSRERLVRVNMADYPGNDDAVNVFGNPHAYTVPARRGELTQRLLGHPFAVLLLDEFEKANEKIHDRFLQLVDEGVFVNGAGETVSCRSMIVIATSNAGAEVYRTPGIGFSPSGDLALQDRELDRRLLSHFRLEFLNRFDQVVHFHPLSRGGIRKIALREIQQLRARSGLVSQGLDLEVDDAVLDWLAVHGYDPHYGARFLRRAIERHVTTALADVIVTESPRRGAKLSLGVRAGRVFARVLGSPSDEERAAKVRLPLGTTERVRSLDRPALIGEAQRLLERSQPRREKLDARRHRLAELLETMNTSGFWDAPAEGRPILEEYRELDVAIQTETRLAGPIERLGQAVSDAKVSSPVLGSMLEQAARSLADWERRAAEQGVGAVWLVLKDADPMSVKGEALEQLVQMERAWCRRLHLAAELVAFGEGDGGPNRAVLEVEGPGALTYLEMERGQHRLHHSDGPDGRVFVDLVPQRRSGSHASSVHGTSRRQALGLDASFFGRVQRGELALELFGSDRDTLGRLLADLEGAALAESNELARVYRADGAGARDPRTHASVARFKDVMAGRLDALLDAWQAHNAREL